MRLCDLVNSADFGGPGAALVSKDETSTEEEQKNIGDRRAKEFAAAEEQAFNQTQAQLPGNLNWEALRWFAEGSGRRPLFGNPPKKLWNGRLQSGG